MDWPEPPEKMPRWWQFKLRKRLKELEIVFGPLDQEALDRYHIEIGIGQSIIEDAGGYLFRAYSAMLGLPVQLPRRPEHIIQEMLAARRRREDKQETPDAG